MLKSVSAVLMAIVPTGAGSDISGTDHVEVIDPGELASGHYGFTTYVAGADVASGWFQLNETDIIKVKFDSPLKEELVGAFVVNDSRVCFGGFAAAEFPSGCGEMSLHTVHFPNDVHLWFARAEPGAFYPGDNLELFGKRRRESP